MSPCLGPDLSCRPIFLVQQGGVKVNSHVVHRQGRLYLTRNRYTLTKLVIMNLQPLCEEVHSECHCMTICCIHWLHTGTLRTYLDQVF